MEDVGAEIETDWFVGFYWDIGGGIVGEVGKGTRGS